MIKLPIWVENLKQNQLQASELKVIIILCRKYLIIKKKEIIKPRLGQIYYNFKT